MSDTPPSFDSAKAQALIDQLNDAIHLLTTQTTNRTTRAQAMQEHWKGGYANRFFENEMPRLRGDAAFLTARMGALISQLNSASEAATQASAQYRRAHEPPQGPGAPGPAPTPPAPAR